MLPFQLWNASNWPVRAAVAACLSGLACLASMYWHYGAREIHRADSPANIPVASVPPSEDDWPGLFGPRGTGECLRTGFPRGDSASRGVDWQLQIPGPALGGACLWGNLVVTPVFDAGPNTLSLLAVDRRDGQLLWKTELRSGWPVSTKRQLHSVMPACDGQSFFLGLVDDQQLLIAAVDLQGQLRWTNSVGPMPNENGRLVSPLVHGSLVITPGENRGVAWLPGSSSSHLTAVHRLTGEIIWRVTRPHTEGTTLPALAQIAGKTQLIVPAPGLITAYDPTTGTTIWTCRWDASRSANSVAWNERMVFATTSDPHPLTVAIRADGTGDVTDTHIAWQSSAFGSSLISPVRSHAVLVGLNEVGTLTCVECLTGKVQWREHLKGTYSLTPVAAGSELWCLNQEGTATTIEISERGKIVSQRVVVSGVDLPPAATARQLVLCRTTKLICLPWDDAEIPLVNTPDRPRQRF